MEESKIMKIEEKLRKMLMSKEQEQNNNKQVNSKLNGARVIRRRKGLPDMLIS